LGARKIVVINIGPIGCIPFERESDPMAGYECSVEPNEVAQMYNLKLKILVEELNNNLQGSRFVYGDVFRIVYDIIQNYSSYGFESEKIPCCSLVGKVGGLIPCGPPSKVCMDRSKYVFWDPYHPTEAANIIIARRLLSGDTSDIYPINIRQLANLKINA
jgi:phospholipase/lecithinase/hemolysin